MGRCKRVLLRLAQLLLSGLGIPVSALLSLKVGNLVGCKIDIDAYQLVLFAFVGAFMMVGAAYETATGQQLLPRLAGNPPPVWINGSTWYLTPQGSRILAKLSQGPLESTGFYTCIRICLAVMLMNPLWIVALMQTECSLTENQQTYYWIFASLSAILSIMLIILALVRFCQSCKRWKPETFPEILRATGSITRQLKDPEVTVRDKLNTVLDFGQMDDHYTPLFLEGLFLAFAWRIKPEEIEQLSNRGNRGLQFCALCDTAFTDWQKVIMFPCDHINIEPNFHFRRLLQMVERDPDRRIVEKLRQIRNSGSSVVEVIHPQPSATMLELIQEVDAIWLSSAQNPPKTDKPALRLPNYKKSVTEFKFIHTDCFTKLGLAERTAADSGSYLAPMRYRSALTWATTRLAELQIQGCSQDSIPRFLGVLSTPPYKRPPEVADQRMVVTPDDSHLSSDSFHSDSSMDSSSS